MLRELGVTRLVDIRRIPRSRTNPQFNLEVLPATLPQLQKIWRTSSLASLGGRRTKSERVEEGANAAWQRRSINNYADYAETAAFRKGLRELLEMASRETCAIMCAEAVWWRCHRRIIADHLLAHGVPVVHVLSREKSEPASLTPFAVIGAWRSGLTRILRPGCGRLATALAPTNDAAGPLCFGRYSVALPATRRTRAGSATTVPTLLLANPCARFREVSVPRRRPRELELRGRDV